MARERAKPTIAALPGPAAGAGLAIAILAAPFGMSTEPLPRLGAPGDFAMAYVVGDYAGVGTDLGVDFRKEIAQARVEVTRIWALASLGRYREAISYFAQCVSDAKKASAATERARLVL